MGKKTEDIEKAFTAGFNDENITLDPAAELEEIKPAAELEKITPAAAAKDLETPPVLDQTPEVKKEDDVDEWEGMPPSVKAHFESLTAKLDSVTNIANSASGRANKLQSKLDKQSKQKPAEQPKPTSDQLLAAMTSTDKREKLGEDFPEFAADYPWPRLLKY